MLEITLPERICAVKDCRLESIIYMKVEEEDEASQRLDTFSSLSRILFIYNCSLASEGTGETIAPRNPTGPRNADGSSIGKSDVLSPRAALGLPRPG